MYNRCQLKPLFKRIHFSHARTATQLWHLQDKTNRLSNVAAGNSPLQAKIVLTCDYGYGCRYSQYSFYHGHGVCFSEMYLAILLKSFVSISKHTVVTEFLEGQLKCDNTRAETRFRLPAKRTSPFKSARASVKSTTGNRVARISGSNAGYTIFRGSMKVYWLPTPFVSFPFTSPPMRHRVPSHFNWSLPSNTWPRTIS